MILLKHLAREYDVDPRKLRSRLRKKFGKHSRWQWKDESDPELVNVRIFLSQSSGKTTVVSRKRPTSSRVSSTHSPPAGMLAAAILSSPPLTISTRYERT